MTKCEELSDPWTFKIHVLSFFFFNILLNILENELSVCNISGLEKVYSVCIFLIISLL